jgi:putative transposase
MPNTYIQLYIQIVFAVKGRNNFISKQHKEELHKYITGIVQNRKHKMLAIHAMPDHVHLFAGLNPTQSISDLSRDVKSASSGFINEKRWVAGKFNWQEGFGAFSYSRSQIDAVVKYINNQEAHHAKRSFREEYLDLLQKFGIEYEEKYLFEFYD